MAFTKANGYSDAAKQVLATYYAEGKAQRDEGDWNGAVNAFTNAGDYNYAKVQITETSYQHAQSLMKSGDYNQAYALFVTLKGYADVDSLLANDENLLAASDELFSVGNYVPFGTYPQTSAGSDQTPIEWLVLDRDGDNALLLSRYGLDAKSYNAEPTSITWEKCTLRTWLNDDFMNRAFTATEQSAILLTNVDNSSIQCYNVWSASGGNNTQDKVFLLSCAEANKYLDATWDDYNNTKSRVTLTAYAISQRAETSDSNKTADGEYVGWWWLRSPGYFQNYAAYVDPDGSLYDTHAHNEWGSVRPALWVNLDSGIF